jgi:hypothetical protein
MFVVPNINKTEMSVQQFFVINRFTKVKSHICNKVYLARGGGGGLYFCVFWWLGTGDKFFVLSLVFN